MTGDLLVVLPQSCIDGERILRATGADIAIVDEQSPAYAKTIATADALITRRLIPKDVALASRLRLVHAVGTGVENIDASALPRGCALCNAYGHENIVAEWVLGAILALRRDVVTYDREIRLGRWPDLTDGAKHTRELRGRILGLVGYGHIGRRTAELARGIGMRTIAVTRTPDPAHANGAEWLGGLGDLPRLLTESDVVVVCLPLNADTEGLIGPRELKQLGEDGLLVNVGRGPVVEEHALYEALRDRTIAGAAIDVWYHYGTRRGDTIMPSDEPFWELDNIVMSPHIAGVSRESSERRWRFIGEQLTRLIAGEPLENIVTVGT
jgi:phosphoglycerate dehydrogenase-like enzyme